MVADEQLEYNGIPDGITEQYVTAWVKQRLSAKRFEHVAATVDTARKLAGVAECDAYLAAIAAWLHDACKEMKESELVLMAEAAGMPLDPMERAHGHLLHGPVAALVAARDLGIKHAGVLEAISQHTLGAAPMSDLSKVVFLSDCLEPGRPADYTYPIWQALDLGGANDFDGALVAACDAGIRHLLDAGKPIHMRILAVRNYYLAAGDKQPARK